MSAYLKRLEGRIEDLEKYLEIIELHMIPEADLDKSITYPYHANADEPN